MSQIASSTKKLQLLQRTLEIEEEERERLIRNVSERNAKYKELKSKNDALCTRSNTEVDLKQEAAQRKALLLRFKESITDMPWMHPIVDLLENSQGEILFFIFIINFRNLIFSFSIANVTIFSLFLYLFIFILFSFNNLSSLLYLCL